MSDLKAANLARIRDNQRRSRARRKEYLQELESKYRACQQLGVEASAEVQAAARKVLEENRRLRSLLRDKGVSDAEIDAYHPDGEMTADSPPATQLEIMLQNRKPCGDEIQRPEPTSWTPKDAQPLPAPVPQRSVPHQRAVELKQEATSPRPLSPYNHVSPVSATDSMSSYSHFPNTPPEEESTEPGTFPHLSYQYDLAPNSPWPMAQPAQSQPDFGRPTPSVYAANIIRNMRMDAGAEFETDFTGQQMSVDCPVPSAMLYEAMERYHRSNIP